MATEEFGIIAVLQARVDGFVNGFRQATDTVNDFTNRNKKTFDSFKQVGAAATAAGLVVAGGLGVAVKTAATFEAQMSKVKAVSGATGKDFERLTETAKHLGATTAFSATQAGEGMEKLALAGWKTDQIISAMPGMLNLAAAGALELGEAADITSDVMSAFGMKADQAGHAADVFAYAQANANTNVSQLGEAMKYAAPMANQMGWSLEETAAAMMKLADNGLKGSIAGQAFATSIGRLSKPTKQMQKKMNELGISFFDAKENMKPLPEVVAELEKATDGLTMKQKSAAITTIFGAEAYKHWAILLESGSETLAQYTHELENADGTAKQMAETMLDNLNGAVTILKSSLEGAAIAIGNVLLPTIRTLVEWLTSLVERFNGFDAVTQKIIVIIATLSAGFLLLTGPILLIIGFIPSILAGFTALSTVGTTIISVLAGTTTAATGVGAAIASMVLPVTLVVAALAALTVGAIKFTNEMSQRAIPEVARFGEGVSESTQEAVGGFMDMTEKANSAFKELAWGQQAVTSEMASNMISSQQGITDTLLTAIENRNSQEINATKLQFSKLESLSDEQKLAIIEKTNARYAEEAQTVETGNARIQDILEAAAEANRSVTEVEAAEILSIREEMSIKAVEVLSANEQEQRMIFEQMKDNATTLSTEEAAAVVKNSVEKKDKVVNDAEEQFTQTRLWAEQQRDELGTLSAEEAQQVINEAQAKRDKSILAAEEAHANVIAEAQAQADEHVNLVDWETGEILTKWDLFKQKHTEVWESIKEKITSTIEGIKEFLSTGLEFIQGIFRTVLEAVSSFVAEKLDYIKAYWEENGELIRSATENVWNAIKAVIEVVMPIIEGIIKVAWFLIQTIVVAVWENIKGVISGALDIILGLVKVFSGLFTGDWTAMWDGIKQLFSGVIEFIWNLMQLMLWGRLLKGVLAFAGAFKGAVTGFWSVVQTTFTTVINAIRSFFTTGFNTMKSVATNTMGSIRTFISTVWEAIKTTFTTVINTIKTTVTTGFGNVVTAVRTKMSEAVTAVATKMTEMLGKVTGKASEFVSAGMDLIRGLISGIKAMAASAIDAITGVVDGVVGKAKTLLGIKSPSRVFMAIGSDTIEGMEIGMSARKKNLDAIMTDLTLSLLDITDHYKSEEAKIHKVANDEIAKIEKRAQEDVAKIQRNAYAKKRKTNQDENLRIQRIQEDAARKIADLEKKATSDSIKQMREADKEKLKQIKLFIDDKKSLEQLSLVDEAILWEESLKLFEEGTKERVDAQKSYQKAVEAVNKEILSINKEFSDKMQKINDDLAKNEQQLNDEYNKTFSARVDLIRNSTGLFDEFVAKMDKSGQDLLNNLRSQVVGLEEWRGTLDSLWGKIDDEELMKELEAMGPKAAGELKALNSLSEAELAEYVELYNQMFAQAREEATHQLSGMKDDTEDRISEMREAANKELGLLEKEWAERIYSVTKTTDDQLKTLKQVGVDAGQGLLNGLSSMEPALIAKATSIANAIKAAMAAALDIHSPSRWMRDFIGKNMMIGWIDGMEAMRSKVIAMAELSTSWMTPEMPVLAGIDIPSYEPRNYSNPLYAKDSPMYGSQGGDFNQHLTIISPSPLTPAGIARRTKQESRDLLNEWRR